MTEFWDAERKSARPLPSQAKLLRLFRYDPETGALYRKIGRYAGARAGFVHCTGYRPVKIGAGEFGRFD